MISRLPHNQGAGRNGAQPLLVVQELNFVYPPPRRIQALRNINLTIQANEFVGIIGQNGSGKTTLTKCISGHLPPTRGHVLIQEREVSRVPIRERPRLVGYTFQNPDEQLFKASVWDDIKFGLENLGYDQATVAGAAEEMLRDLGLWDKRELHPYHLSKGDRQRLSIAVMAVMQPAILIVDEPTTGQDPRRARQIMDLLQHLQQDLDMTIIVVTHAMELVADYCQRVMALYQGEVLLDDRPSQVFAQADILAKTFVQPPPVARLALRLGFNPVPVNVEQAVQMFYDRLKDSEVTMTVKLLYQFEAADSFLHRLDPRSKLVVIICFLILTFSLPYPWLMALIAMALIWLLGRISPLEYYPILLFFLPIMVAIVLVQLFFVGGEPYQPIVIGGQTMWQFSLRGWETGLTIAFRLAAMGIAFLMFSMTTDPL